MEKQATKEEKKKAKDLKKQEEKEAKIKMRLEKKAVKKAERDRAAAAKNKKKEAFVTLPPLSGTNKKVHACKHIHLYTIVRAYSYRWWI